MRTSYIRYENYILYSRALILGLLITNMYQKSIRASYYYVICCLVVTIKPPTTKLYHFKRI